MNWNKIPGFLWSLVIKYYGIRIIGTCALVVVNAWVYFLRLALPMCIIVSKNDKLYKVYSPSVNDSAIMRTSSSDVEVYLQNFFKYEYAALNPVQLSADPVVDLGANTRFFMLFAKAKWPTIKILPIEAVLRELSLEVLDREFVFVKRNAV